MALLSCPECHGKVSSAAASCPHCGHPLAAPQENRGPRESVAPPALRPGQHESAHSERVLWEGTPSLKMLTVEALLAAAFAIIAVVALVWLLPLGLDSLAGLSRSSATLVAERASSFRTVAFLCVGAAVAWRWARLGWRALELRHSRYRVTSQRLTWETGVVGRNLTELDMRTIEDVGLRQSLAERLLGLGTIDITTSDAAVARGGGGGGKGRLVLVGISGPRDVREAIRDASYQATHGQLFTRST